MSIRITINTDRCTGHGRCYVLAPEVFEPDDDGYSVARASVVDDDLTEAAQLGSSNCPEDAINVVEE